MAITPISVDKDLSEFITEIRTLSDTVSEQLSGVIDPQLIDLIGNIVQRLRTRAGSLVDGFYEIEYDGTWATDAAGLEITALTTKNIADINRVRVEDTLLKSIPIVNEERFTGWMKHYPTARLATMQFAKITAMESGGIFIRAHIGSSLTAGVPRVTYIRNPVKATLAADMIDLPDSIMPIAVDMALIDLFRKLKSEKKIAEDPPAYILQRNIADLQEIDRQIGQNITPQNA